MKSGEGSEGCRGRRRRERGATRKHTHYNTLVPSAISKGVLVSLSLSLSALSLSLSLSHGHILSLFPSLPPSSQPPPPFSIPAPPPRPPSRSLFPPLPHSLSLRLSHSLSLTRQRTSSLNSRSSCLTSEFTVNLCPLRRDIPLLGLNAEDLLET